MQKPNTPNLTSIHVSPTSRNEDEAGEKERTCGDWLKAPYILS